MLSNTKYRIFILKKKKGLLFQCVSVQYIPPPTIDTTGNTQFCLQYFVTKERNTTAERTLDHYEFNHTRTRKMPAKKKKGETQREEKKRKIGGKRGCMRYNYMQH